MPALSTKLRSLSPLQKFWFCPCLSHIEFIGSTSFVGYFTSSTWGSLSRIPSFQKQLSGGVLRKRCSENMQQVKGEHPCRSVISTECSPVNLMRIFWTPFTKNTSRGLLLSFSWHWFSSSNLVVRRSYRNTNSKIPCYRNLQGTQNNVNHWDYVNWIMRTAFSYIRPSYTRSIKLGK